MVQANIDRLRVYDDLNQGYSTLGLLTLFLSLL